MARPLLVALLGVAALLEMAGRSAPTSVRPPCLGDTGDVLAELDADGEQTGRVVGVVGCPE